METPTSPFEPMAPMPAPQVSPQSPVMPVPQKSGNGVLVGTVVIAIILAGAYAAYAHNTGMWPFAPTVQPILSTSPSPSVSADPTARWKTYTNTQYGFSLMFTDPWVGYSITQQQLAGDTPHVDLGFSVNDLGTKYTGFWISVYSKANWQKRLEQGGQSGMVIGQNGTYVFVATYPQAPPGDPKLKNLNNPSVLSTFRLTN